MRGLQIGMHVGRIWGFSLGSGTGVGPMGQTVVDKTQILETAPGTPTPQQKTCSESVFSHSVPCFEARASLAESGGSESATYCFYLCGGRCMAPADDCVRTCSYTVRSPQPTSKAGCAVLLFEVENRVWAVSRDSWGRAVPAEGRKESFALFGRML